MRLRIKRAIIARVYSANRKPSCSGLRPVTVRYTQRMSCALSFFGRPGMRLAFNASQPSARYIANQL